MSHKTNPIVPGDTRPKPGFDMESPKEPVRQASSPRVPRPNHRAHARPAASNPADRVRVPSPRRENRPEPAPVEQKCVYTKATSFEEFAFDQRIQRAVQSAGYEIPTPIQSATIPAALAGRDIIGTAQTGTGKTAAFVLPILQHLLSNPSPRPMTRVLVMTPTRELAEQVSDAFKQFSRFTKIRVATVYGGVGMMPQERALRLGFEVIVACPGRLLDHIGRGNTDLTHVDRLVVDEADRMLDMGFLPSIKRILSYLSQDRQNMLFSATFAPELTQLAASTFKNPERIDVDICAPAKTVEHALYPCPQHLKTMLLLRLLTEVETNSVLIFTRTKHRADRLARQMQIAGHVTATLHSDKSQGQRQTALDSFRSGRCPILIATDIAARGLDIESVSHVINYDVPDTADAYIHRIGRTGRAEREGDAMTFVTKDDAGIVWDIERALGSQIEQRKLADFDYAIPDTSSERNTAAVTTGRAGAARSSYGSGSRRR